MAKRHASVKLQPDLETEALFAQLMKEAGKGDIVGAVVISLRRRQSDDPLYTLSLSGQFASNPTYAAGATDACAVLIRELALKHAGLK